MKKQIIFTLLFLFSLSGIQIASFDDWLILSLIIHLIWVMILSNEMIKSLNLKNKFEKTVKIINKVSIYLFIIDVLMIFLSMSFLFRLIFAYLYRPMFYLTCVCIFISTIVNYYVIINELLKRKYSLVKKIGLILSSIFYPIGIYSIKSKYF